MKVSIVIPNFNGCDILRKNLPNVLESGADEILVADDGSSDDSVEILKKEFAGVKLLENKVNLGFIPTVNKLFNEASGEIVVLLNSDVLVEKDFLNFLTSHFKDKKVFAVNCHEDGEGWSEAFWKNGFFEYQRGEEGSNVHKSSWASGGSAAYNKEIWQSLGGFDPLFAPFYWEDVDLSFRAIKAGFKVLWEPKAKVYHQHETTIKKSFNQRYITWVKERNQLLFIWKNIHDQKLLRSHWTNLVKRLLIKSGPGYFIPFIWALLRIHHIKHNPKEEIISDQKAINYAQN